MEATEIALRDLDFLHFPHPRILYEYDFGDSWLHWIESDPQMPSEDGIKYPICIDGARHCPPEDVGGPRGYADFLKAWCDPTHPEHRAMKTWAGRSFDPEAFDIAKTNKAIAAARRWTPSRARDATMAQRQGDAGVGVTNFKRKKLTDRRSHPFLAERTQFHLMKSIILTEGAEGRLLSVLTS